MQLKRASAHPDQMTLPLFELPLFAQPLAPQTKPAPTVFVPSFVPSTVPSISPIAAPSPTSAPRVQWDDITEAVATPAVETPTPTLPTPRNDQRIAVLLGERVPYTFRRSTRKTIGFSVGDEGLSIAAPRWVRLADVDAAMEEKARWILTKLNQQRERRAQLVQRRVEWRDGAQFPFMGSEITITLNSSMSDTLFDADAKTLRIALPMHAEATQIKDRVQAWLQRQAKRVFDERVSHYAERLRVRVREVKLSNANTRWGTASADGDIRLNWRLIHFALPVIDYVAAHEVAHLREMNHGPAFWATVKSIFPEFEAAKAQLKDEKLPKFEE
jgi:predicted metal-dependent hydrolase